MLLRRYPHLFSETSESATVLSRFLSAETTDRGKKLNNDNLNGSELKKIQLSNRFLLTLIAESILESLRVEEKHCLELIAVDIRRNDGTISYPSTLGEDCNVKTKVQLILFLVCIVYAKQI